MSPPHPGARGPTGTALVSAPARATAEEALRGETRRRGRPAAHLGRSGRAALRPPRHHQLFERVAGFLQRGLDVVQRGRQQLQRTRSRSGVSCLRRERPPRVGGAAAAGVPTKVTERARAHGLRCQQIKRDRRLRKAKGSAAGRGNPDRGRGLCRWARAPTPPQALATAPAHPDRGGSGAAAGPAGGVLDAQRSRERERERRCHMRGWRGRLGARVGRGELLVSARARSARGPVGPTGGRARGFGGVRTLTERKAAAA